ncbi:MAG: hypothetical protein LBQ49_01505 [Rickettsiales bacterium]|jgi:hypothetical protein|nr:hypothetical protein [Rickettsiales bacterium]
MARAFPNILSSYDPNADFDELEKLKIPGASRWNGGVELYQTGLRSPDIMRIDPRASDADILMEFHEFDRRRKLIAPAPMIVLRIDNPSHKVMPPASYGEFDRGGDDGAIAAIRQLLKDGFAPAFFMLEGAQYSLKGAATISFLQPGEIAVEIVGPGYDDASCTKGYANIPVRVTMKPYAPPLLELADDMRHLGLYIDIWDEAKALPPDELKARRDERRRTRIEWLARLEKKTPEEFVEFLKKTGHTGLFADEVPYDMNFIKKLFRWAKAYAEFRIIRKLPFNGDSLGIQIPAGGRPVLVQKWDYFYRRPKKQ